MALGVQIIVIIGFLLSVYAYYVEWKASRVKNYKAVCDISENMSCGKAFNSPYGKTFGVSNSIGGIIFYIFIFFLSNYDLMYVFYFSILAILGSIYLAYVSYFKLKNFCLVCIAIYVVNVLLLYFSYIKI
ncbi:vitamin K epoxide reductase family protein [Candidatus Woesearchaeota archaeon]|nr:vitamin K epoxide reductase family protein [Candidatus Woesearchaeota archaeon]